MLFFECRWKKILIGVGVLCLAAGDALFAAEQLDPWPIEASDGTALGYVHSFVPTSSHAGRHAGAPIVFLPGFDIDLAKLIEADNTTQSGTRSAGLRLVRRLVHENSAIPNSAHSQILEGLVDERGHSVYVVEYADPNAGMEHNALAVQALLTNPAYPIKSRQQSDGTRALVFGWSMGGLVGRYALTQLEHQAIDHNTSVYVSLDAPHQGAYLPLSLEAFVGLMPEIMAGDSSVGDMVEFNTLLAGAAEKYNAAAAKQMLALHIGRNSSEPFSATLSRRYAEIRNNPETQSAHPDFYSSRNTLRVMGDYPTQLRKIAFSNGNLLGNQQPLPLPRNHNRLIRMTASVPVTARFKLKLLDVHLFEDTAQFARSNCAVSFFFKRTQCARFRMPSQHENLSVRPGSYNDVIGRLGVVFNNQRDLQNEWQRLGYSISFTASVPTGEGRSTFIPIHSALDIRTDAFQITGADLKEHTPFDAVYANASENMPHNVLSDELVVSIKNEIDQSAQQWQIANSLPAILH